MVLMLLLGAGVWGVVHLELVEERSARDRATSLAVNTAAWFQQQLGAATATVTFMAAMVAYDPQYSSVSKLFVGLAPALAVSSTVKQLEYVPNGVVRDIYPMIGNNAAAGGFDLFASVEDKEGAIRTVQDNTLTLVGPLTFAEGGSGVIVRYPIFVSNVTENETFGIPDPLNPACGAPCEYNATTRTKFWGFAAGLLDLDALTRAATSELQTLEKLGYRYSIRAPGATAAEVVASSEMLPEHPVEAIIELPNTQWVVALSPGNGWEPASFGGMMAAVVVVATAMAMLLLTTLVSRRQHEKLLEALLPRELIEHLESDAEHELGPRIIEAATTADLLLKLLGQLLEGDGAPDLRDIVLIRQQILQNMDIYQPLNLSDKLRDANLDDDVTKSLVQQLGGKMSSLFRPLLEREKSFKTMAHETRAGAVLMASMSSNHHDEATLAGALSMILSPQTGWYDCGPDASDAASDAALPTHDTEAAPSPRLSNHSIMGLAASRRIRNSSSYCGSSLHGMADITVHRNSNGPTTPGSIRVLMAGPSAVMEGGPIIDSAAGYPELPRPAPAATATVAAAVPVVLSGSPRFLNIGSGVRGAAEGIGFFGSGPARWPKWAESHSSRAIGSAGQWRGSMLGNGGGGGGGGGADSHAPEWRAGACGSGMPSSCGRPDPTAALPMHDSGHTEQQHAEVGRRLWARSPSYRSSPGSAQGPFVAAKKAPAPPPPIIEEVEKVLAKADAWNFDTARLREVTNGHPLSALGYFLIHRAGLITSLKLKPTVLARLLRHVEAGYAANPYHNSTHAADVLQTLHVVLHGAQLHVHYLDRLGLLAAYFAAIVHDYGHPGLTNDFLVTTSDPLAVRYNDRSPLENHHAAAAFSAMRRPGLDLLAPLSTEQRAAFRKQVIEMVLATDMKQHFSLLSHFNTVHRIATYPNKPGGGVPAEVASSLTAMEPETVAVGAPSLLQSERAPRPVDDTERLLSLQIVIKAADLGHLGKEFEAHKRWLSVLEEEFFRQGDRERELGMPMSPLFDRTKQGVSKSQTGFYEFVALPLVHALVSAFPGARPLMRAFLTNYQHYRELDPPPPPPAEPPRSEKPLLPKTLSSRLRVTAIPAVEATVKRSALSMSEMAAEL